MERLDCGHSRMFRGGRRPHRERRPPGGAHRSQSTEGSPPKTKYPVAVILHILCCAPAHVLSPMLVVDCCLTNMCTYRAAIRATRMSRIFTISFSNLDARICHLDARTASRCKLRSVTLTVYSKHGVGVVTLRPAHAFGS